MAGIAGRPVIRMVRAPRLRMSDGLTESERGSVTPAQNTSSAAPGPVAEVYQAPRQDKPWGQQRKGRNPSAGWVVKHRES